MSRFNVWPWVRPFLILILVLSVPPVVYWFGYVKSSVASARREAYTTLSAVTADLRSRLIAHDQIATNAEKRTPDRDAHLTEYLNSLLKNPSISEIPTQPGQSHLGVGGAYGGLQLRMGRIVDTQICRASSPCTAQAVIPLENLLPWNVVETEFDGLLVLDSKLKLLAQDRRLPVQPTGVEVPLQVKNAPATQGAKPKEEEPFQHLFDFPNEGALQLSGVDYVAFIQVVKVPVTAIAAEEKTKDGVSSLEVLVAGLIAKDRLRSEAIQLSPQILILAGALVALGVFAIPFLKLRFIGECERMRRRDVWWLAASLLSATALMTLVVLDLHAGHKLRSRFDSGLQRLTASIALHLNNESNRAVEELRRSAPKLLPDIEVKDQCDPRKVEQDPAPAGAILAKERFTAYPDMEAVLVSDVCGNQLRKWMPRTIPTTKINHQSESFFAPGLALAYDPTPAGANTFAFGATIAPTSGLRLGVYAVPVDSRAKQLGAGVEPAKRTGVAAIATIMHSLSTPVIARPYQFVLIERGGTVVFQKSRSSYQGERFFESVRGGDVLKIAARSGEHRPQTYRYRDKSYRMIATDIPKLQLTLVTYYETDVIGALSARIFSTAAVFALGLVIAILLGAVFALSALNEGEGVLDWAWPSTSRTAHFVIGFLVCALWIALLLTARKWLDNSYGLALVILLMPPIFLIAVGYAYVKGLARSDVMQCAIKGVRVVAERVAPRSLQFMARVFIGLAVMTLLAFVAWPTLIIFNDAFNLQTTAFAAEVTQSWWADRQKLNDVTRDAFVRVNQPLDAASCSVKPDLRCSTPERIYVLEPNFQLLAAQRDDFALYNDCGRLKDTKPRCDAAQAPEAPFSFTFTVARWLSMFGRDSAEHSKILLTFGKSQSNTEHGEVFDGSQWSPWLIAFVWLVISLWLLVRSIANHVLGIKMTDGDLLDESHEVTQQNGDMWLLLRPSRRALARLRQPLDRCDLRNAGQSNFAQPSAGYTLLIEHLEARLADDKMREALLNLLAGKRSGCLVITSEIDPLHYLTRRLREKTDDLRAIPGDDKNKERRDKALEACGQLRDEIAKWATVLRSSRKIRECVPPFPAFARTGRNAWVRAKLAEECASTEFLIDIGERLLEREDLYNYRWDDIVGFVLDAAEPYYRSIWELCSREEQLVLIQLAQEGLVNPKRAEIVRRLARRKLVVVDPRFRLMSKSFQRFVCSVEPPERVMQWERTGGSMSWARLGTPLYALAAMVIVVLLFAEQGMFTDILAIATGSAAALGSLRSIYASVKGSAGKEGTPA
jgi:hypothetical protein